MSSRGPVTARGGRGGPLDGLEQATSGTAPGIPPEVDDPRDAGLTQHGCALGTGLESGQERVPSEAARSLELNDNVDLGMGESAPGELWGGGATLANPTACSDEDLPRGVQKKGAHRIRSFGRSLPRQRKA